MKSIQELYRKCDDHIQTIRNRYYLCCYPKSYMFWPRCCDQCQKDTKVLDAWQKFRNKQRMKAAQIRYKKQNPN